MKRETTLSKLSACIRDNHLQRYMESDLLSISELVYFDKNEYLIQAGFPSDHLYFLVSGEVIISSYTATDKSTCVSYCRKPTMIGEAASLWQMIPSRSVRAITSCVCIAINLNLHRQKLLHDRLFLQNVCQVLAYKLNDENGLCGNLSEALEIRLSRFILSNSPGDTFAFQLTNCADILNTSYRHLLRMMKGFCMMGALEKRKNGYQVLNRNLLQQISEGAVAVNGILES